MSIEGLVFGLLDTSLAIGHPQAAAKYRGFTISWSRYGYRGVIIERDSVDGILAEADECGYRYCFIQPCGHIIQEHWTLENRQSRDFFAALQVWIDKNDFFVTGSIASGRDAWFGFAPGCLLVNLEKYRQLAAPRFGVARGSPIEVPKAVPIVNNGRIVSLLPSAETEFQRPGMPGWHLIFVSLKSGVPVLGFGEDLLSRMLNLEATCPSRAKAFTRYLGEGLAPFCGESSHQGLSPDQLAFLNVVERQTANARRGVFLWNIESYADIETPERNFTPPVSSLYSVAAGFKPNQILHTHGFDEDTRVVYFDYSPNALEVKKCMVEEWDGEDFPHFVKYLFKTYPHPETFYQLWEDLTPNEVNWKDIEELWQRELNRWGGVRILRDHWQRYRELQHEYVCCDVLTDSSALLEKVANDARAIIWWSNAFFTVYGNWFYTLDERKQAYDQWIEQIASINPNLYLFGSDYNNINVNSVQAGEYWDQYQLSGGSCLIPRRLCQTQIRM